MTLLINRTNQPPRSRGKEDGMVRAINLNQLKAEFPLAYRVLIKGDLTAPPRNSWANAKLKFNKLKALDNTNKV